MKLGRIIQLVLISYHKSTNKKSPIVGARGEGEKGKAQLLSMGLGERQEIKGGVFWEVFGEAQFPGPPFGLLIYTKATSTERGQG